MYLIISDVIKMSLAAEEGIKSLPVGFDSAHAMSVGERHHGTVWKRFIKSKEPYVKEVESSNKVYLSKKLRKIGNHRLLYSINFCYVDQCSYSSESILQRF